MIQLVIFDCDGVLVDSEPITTRVLADAIAELGLDWGVEGTARFQGGSLQGVLRAVEAELGRPPPEDFTERFRARLFATLRDEVEPVDGIVDALDRLAYPACVASNGPHPKMAATLGVTGLLPRFEGRIFSGYDTGIYKPEPDLFLRAAAALGADPARCVVVEDSAPGLAAAKAAGMARVAYVPRGLALQPDGALQLDDMRRLNERLAQIVGGWSDGDG